MCVQRFLRLLIVVAVQVNPLSWGEAVRLRIAALVPPAYVAMREALWALGIVPVVAKKLVEL